jgi:hypothetical protein
MTSAIEPAMKVAISPMREKSRAGMVAGGTGRKREKRLKTRFEKITTTFF